MGGPEVEQLIGLFARLPGLGPRSARRAVLRLLQAPESRMLPLAAAMRAAAEAVSSCRICGNLDSRNPCLICTDPGRDQAVICVVEGVGELWALERALVHRGLYHVLGGTLSPLAGIGPEDLHTEPLLARIRQGGVSEIILALGATVDGATTAHWLTDRLTAAQGGTRLTISRLAQGVPIGGALDGLDDGTLAAALRARRPA